MQDLVIQIYFQRLQLYRYHYALPNSIGEEGTEDANIPVEELPRCNKSQCGGLLRPYIIWYDEDPTDDNLRQSCID